MRGTIRWYSATQSTGEFQYDIAQKDFDDSEKTVRETVLELLESDWDTFGEPGDCIIVVSEEE